MSVCHIVVAINVRLAGSHCNDKLLKTVRIDSIVNGMATLSLVILKYPRHHCVL